MSDFVARLRCALEHEQINLQPLLEEAADRIEALEAALVDATAHLTGAVSAYRQYARRAPHLGRGPADALFTTRAADFDNAAERASRALQPPGCDND